MKNRFTITFVWSALSILLYSHSISGEFEDFIFESNKISTRIKDLVSQPSISRRSLNAEYDSIWVYFVDKGPSEQSIPFVIDPSSTSHPFTHLTEQSLQRRSKNNHNGESLVTVEDLPVYEEYIQKVLAQDENIVVRKKSRWLNAVSLSVPKSTTKSFLEKVHLLDFVLKIDVVDSFQSGKHIPPFSNNGFGNKSTSKLLKKVEIAGLQKLEGERQVETSISYGNSLEQLSQINVISAHSQGLNGTGVIVMITDSGFMKTHQAFKSLKILSEYDFVDDDNNTQSAVGNANNHGTSTLSNLGGFYPSNINGTENPGIIGTAFGATFLLARTEDVSNESPIEEDNFIAALEWGESLGVQVVSSSLGYSDWYTYPDMTGSVAPISLACDFAVAKGVVLVVSAGNDGGKGVSAPADSFNVISVGAVDFEGAIASFSSIGPTADGRVKPEVCARGRRNWVASATPTGDTYSRNSGTSFSCPLVAGVAALMLEANPTWTPNMVKEALLQTSSSSNSPDIHYGWGIVDAMAAINYEPKLSGSCSTNSKFTCGDSGACCDSMCACFPDVFGVNCDTNRVECGSLCLSRGGKCIPQPSLDTFRCVASDSPLNTDQVPINACLGCHADTCGVCFGKDLTCSGCDGVLRSNKTYDLCGVCGGDSSSCDYEHKSKTQPITIAQIGYAILFVGIFAIVIGAGIYLVCLLRKRQQQKESAMSMGFNQGFFPLAEDEETELDDIQNDRFNIGIAQQKDSENFSI
eukprot:TRINITY_DN2172_c0_g1_i2.p1 TRINITY_DN2172_c0_g1~~TRINITY_DN2172_c0_g1_i2.p1  ORF type:complete len:749 (-),score=145.04 TRINITY_DN2172_c0_g1_i2:40-2286(-)